MLVLLIDTFRGEIDSLLRSYDKDPVPGDLLGVRMDEDANICFNENDDGLNLLHRLLLDMIYREGYVLRVCGIMLGCRSDLVTRIHEDALTRLSLRHRTPDSGEGLW